MNRWRMLTSLVNGSWFKVNGYDARRNTNGSWFMINGSWSHTVHGS